MRLPWHCDLYCVVSYVKKMEVSQILLLVLCFYMVSGFCLVPCAKS